MNNRQDSNSGTKATNQELIAELLGELHDCFGLFQDGIINDDTFVGGLPLAYLNADGSLQALTLEESRQIKYALADSSTHSKRPFGFALPSFINWIQFLKGDDEKLDKDAHDAPSPAITGSDGKILPLPKDINPNSLIQARLKEQGLPRLGAYWHAINEKLEEKRLELQCGDLTPIDPDRNKLTAKRFNATPFERAAQEFSVRISSKFCDASGDIISPDLLEEFVNKLIDFLLEKTRSYWSTDPLLLLFDAIVVPVLRPMLYPHTTWISAHNFFSESGAFDVRQLANKRTSFETIPTWSVAAGQQALHFVEESLKHHLSLRFIGLRLFDAFSPYNRKVHSSLHIDPSEYRGKMRTFGPPVHTKDVMQLIQPVPKKPEEELVDRVMTYRSTEAGVWH